MVIIGDTRWRIGTGPTAGETSCERSRECNRWRRIMKTLESDLHDGYSGRVLLGIPTRDETYEIAARTGLPRRGLRFTWTEE
jgi:hypothetical protein